MKKFLVLGIFLLLPTLVFGAGFAKQSLFLSKTPVQEGETVLIHAVVANDAATKFAGSVVFKDADTGIGSVAVTILPGGANAVSLSWTPTAGSHTVTAELTGSDGAVVEKESAIFNVNSKPPPPPKASGGQENLPAATVESSQNIQNQIGSLSPAAEQATKPAFTVIDGLRSRAADIIDSQLANTKAKLAATPQTGVVAGSETTQDPKIQNPWGTAWTILYTLYLYILTVLRFLVGNAGVFYPVLALAFLYLLWKMYRRFRRPAWER